MMKIKIYVNKNINKRTTRDRVALTGAMFLSKMNVGIAVTWNACATSCATGKRIKVLGENWEK